MLLKNMEKFQKEALISNRNKGLILTNGLLKMNQDQTTKMKELASFVMMESISDGGNKKGTEERIFLSGPRCEPQ